jgi:hypothetical protein
MSGHEQRHYNKNARRPNQWVCPQRPMKRDTQPAGGNQIGRLFSIFTNKLNIIQEQSNKIRLLDDIVNVRGHVLDRYDRSQMAGEAIGGIDMSLTIRKIRDEITPNLARTKRKLAALSRMEIRVSIITDDSEVQRIARVHEYGITFNMTDKVRQYPRSHRNVQIWRGLHPVRRTPDRLHRHPIAQVRHRQARLDGIVRMSLDRTMSGA